MFFANKYVMKWVGMIFGECLATGTVYLVSALDIMDAIYADTGKRVVPVNFEGKT